MVRIYKNHDINEDFELNYVDKLGKGASGTVIIGKERLTNTFYAVKIIDKEANNSHRFQRELKILKHLDHINIIRLFSMYEYHQEIHFVMELCQGGHLGDLIAQLHSSNRLDELMVKQLFHQLISAIAHLHSKFIVHRDIKLQNILVVERFKPSERSEINVPQLKIIDFGMATSCTPNNLPFTTKCGTLYTMAPEVIRGSYDEKCDVWSSGVVLYIMLSGGKRPFESVDINRGVCRLSDAGKAAVMTNILSGRCNFSYLSNKGVSLEAIRYAQELLKPQYKQRISSMKALEHAWLQVSVHRFITAIPSVLATSLSVNPRFVLVVRIAAAAAKEMPSAS